jgi:HD-GYP domain-containing protein (c-di-GMP phosphodiesterase class II)
MNFPWNIAQIILEHHERVDGSGYPNGLKGDSICEEARIIAVADTVEAMSSDRPYRKSKGIEAALEEITMNREILYDGRVVDACLDVFKEDHFEFTDI